MTATRNTCAHMMGSKLPAAPNVADRAPDRLTGRRGRGLAEHGNDGGHLQASL